VKEALRKRRRAKISGYGGWSNSVHIDQSIVELGWPQSLASNLPNADRMWIWAHIALETREINYLGDVQWTVIFQRLYMAKYLTETFNLDKPLPTPPSLPHMPAIAGAHPLLSTLVSSFSFGECDKLHISSVVTLSKKWSQEKSYKVRGQSDVCHTSVMFTPAFPWHQMGGEFSHRLVSTLSYILYTCLCQEFSKWFIFFLKFPVCMCYLQLCARTCEYFNKS